MSRTKVDEIKATIAAKAPLRKFGQAAAAGKILTPRKSSTQKQALKDMLDPQNDGPTAQPAAATK